MAATISTSLCNFSDQSTMIVVKATKDSEVGKFPQDDKEKMFEAMTTYHEELAKAGVLLDAAGLQPSAKGWRVKYSPRKAHGD